MSGERTQYLALMREIEDFLYAEADALDERRFDEWLALIDDDIRYRVPLRKNLPFRHRDQDVSSEDDTAWIDDDKLTLTKRVRQIMTGIHWAEEPLSRVTHVVSNVRLRNREASPGEGAELEVGSRIVVHRSRLDEESETLYGRRVDVLRRKDGRLLLARRTVVLDQATLLSKNLTVFL